jgi:glutathione S-transferase
MRLLDAQLGGRDFLLGAQFTMADIPLGACAYRWYGLDQLAHPELQALRGWYERLTARAAFRLHVMLPLT